jgi:hypothetical protein
MPLARQWSYPQTTTTTEANEAVTVAAQSGAPGFILNADGFSSPNIVTAPPNSASVYAPASYTANAASVATIVQNTLGYDALFIGYFQGTASVATFSVGVGSSATPAMVTVATNQSSPSGTILGSWEFPQYVAAGYYYSWQVSQANAASVPSGALTIVASPV